MLTIVLFFCTASLSLKAGINTLPSSPKYQTEYVTKSAFTITEEKLNGKFIFKKKADFLKTDYWLYRLLVANKMVEERIRKFSSLPVTILFLHLFFDILSRSREYHYTFLLFI